MRSTVRRMLRDERGATAIEYCLIITVLSLAIVAGVGTAANSLQYMWANNNSELNKALDR